jgi:hypothetical protein
MNPDRKWGHKKAEKFPATTILEGYAVEPGGGNGSSQQSLPIIGPQLLHRRGFGDVLNIPQKEGGVPDVGEDIRLAKTGLSSGYSPPDTWRFEGKQRLLESKGIQIIHTIIHTIRRLRRLRVRGGSVER